MRELQRENRHGIDRRRAGTIRARLRTFRQVFSRWALPLAPLVTLAAMVAYPLWFFLFPASEGHFHLDCLCRRLSGLPCPFCGFTRSVVGLYGGNVEQALFYNPFSLVWIVFLLYLSIAFLLRGRLSSKLMSVGELQLFGLLFIFSWAAKLFIGTAYY